MSTPAKWQFHQVAGPFGLTEGPAWDGEALLFSNLPNSRILRYHPKTQKTEIYRQGTRLANGLMLDSRGRLFACEAAGRCIACYHRDGHRTVIADSFQGKRLNSPNDLAIDTKGRIWFSDPDYSPHWAEAIGPPELEHKAVYRLDPRADGSWSIRRMTHDTARPNGLLVTPDLRTLYVAESDFQGDRQLRAYPVLEDDTLGPCEILHDFAPHRGIDGMCLDVEGNIVAAAGWEKSGPGGMIYVFDPRGRVLERHPTPCARPTNCSWGGPDLRTLYLTSVCGRLYRIETDRKGWLLFP